MVAKRKISTRDSAKPGKNPTAKKTVKKPAVAKKPARKKPVRAAAAKPGKSAARPAKAPRPPARGRASRPRAGALKKARRLGTAQLRKFRQALLAKREELLQAYLNAKVDSRDRAQDGTEDYIDYAVSSYDREFLLSLTELDQRHLMLVEEALHRIDRRAEYGRCAQCQQEIPVKRLEVQPWARYCLRCQELDEQGLLIAEEREPDSDEEVEGDADTDTEEPVEIDDDISDDDSDEDTLDGDRLLGG